MTMIAGARSLSFVVEGTPQTKGSAKGFCPLSWAREAVRENRPPRVVITNDNPAAKAWQEEVAAAAREARRTGPLVRGELMAGAVAVDLAFYLPRPLKLRGGLVSHTTRPDVDKLARCVLDGLTGVVYGDDGQVAAIRLRKQYAPDERARVEITITETTVADPAAPPLFT
jgi:crossover junction endodeoxyribonuclease RusA